MELVLLSVDLWRKSKQHHGIVTTECNPLILFDDSVFFDFLFVCISLSQFCTRSHSFLSINIWTMFWHLGCLIIDLHLSNWETILFCHRQFEKRVFSFIIIALPTHQRIWKTHYPQENAVFLRRQFELIDSKISIFFSRTFRFCMNFQFSMHHNDVPRPFDIIYTHMMFPYLSSIYDRVYRIIDMPARSTDVRNHKHCICMRSLARYW